MRTVLACALAAAVAAGCRPSGGTKVLRQRGTDRYPFVSPLLDVDDRLQFSQMRDLRAQVAALAARRAAAGDLQSMAVFFRDLNRGPWFGVNDDEPFIPASLLKVPIMMVMFKRAEEDSPDLLKLKITPDQDYSKTQDQGLAPEQQVQSGRTYTVEQLIRLMIVNSDNRAHEVLLDFLDRGGFRHLFEDLGLTPPDLRGKQESFISPREYAAFFRILYNASYLSRAGSNAALALLSQSTFREGLVAGLPPGIQVAHKFGIRTYDDKPEVHLHDCGIVYLPPLPYLLCVMTRGKSRAAQADAIRETAALVHEAVSRGAKD